MSGAGIVFRKIRHFHLVITITAQQLPPTAEPRPPPPPPPPVTSPFLLLPPRPALTSSTHPHIRGNLPPAAPTFKRTPEVLALTGEPCQPYHHRTRHPRPRGNAKWSRDTCGIPSPRHLLGGQAIRNLTQEQ
ncbi:hypothetical protein I79_020449 [Cricetulus griseus]|uniref:Uncharacterized protein n=1 Tax=Cricetulus griseus TaxID=10029 RepID=G3IA33_CRIGR|nr:hypothetical protein I79_020449 [Cricetulus griseus]